MEKFEKVKNLGRGSQGTVILVRRKADGSKFVIKRIFVEDQSPEDRNEVMNEIKVLAQLAHPNVVRTRKACFITHASLTGDNASGCEIKEAN